MRKEDMEKKNLIGAVWFCYIQTDKRYVSNYKNGSWDEGTLTSDATITISECAGVGSTHRPYLKV